MSKIIQKKKEFHLIFHLFFSSASLSVDGVYHGILPLNPFKIPYQIDINELLLGALNVQGAKGFRVSGFFFKFHLISLEYFFIHQ